ncbi:hypothetical protein G9466_08865 [Halorussus sp. JP-T4]|nr:hypothetical protein [Halorussus sp. JP-T4]
MLVATLLAATAPAASAPPPRPLCDACGDSFEDTAASHGVDVAVDRSTATLSVHRNGSATWVVRNRLADTDGLARLRANATLRTEIADRAMWDTEFQEATVSQSNVLTLRYREPEFAERSVGGVLRSGAFTEAYGYRNLDGLGADSLAVVAPDGMRVGWTVPGAAVGDDGRRTTLTELDRYGFVTLVPEGATLGPVLSLLAVAALLGPALATNLLTRVAIPSALFGVLVAAACGGLVRFDRRVEPVAERAGAMLAGLGVLAVGLALLSGGVSLLGGAAAPVFGVGAAAIAFGAALSRPGVRERLTYRRLVAGAALGVLVAAASTLAAAVALDQSGLTLAFLTSLPPLVPVFALFPAGYALGAGNRRLAVATATVGFGASLLPFVSLFTPRPQFGPLVVLFAAAYAAAVAAVGAPLLVVGMALAESTPDDPTAGAPSAGR